MKLFDLTERIHVTKHQRSGSPLLDTDPSRQHPQWEGSRLQLHRLQVCASGGKQQKQDGLHSFCQVSQPELLGRLEGNLIPRPVSVLPFVLF